jgi:hypothetical protein
VFDRLPARQRQLINGSIENADPAEVAEANRAYQTAISRQRKTDLNYTKGHIRAKRVGATKSQTPMQSPTQSAPQAEPQAPPSREAEQALYDLEVLREQAREKWAIWRNPPPEYKNTRTRWNWAPDAAEMLYDWGREKLYPEDEKKEPLRQAAEAAQKRYEEAQRAYDQKYGQIAATSAKPRKAGGLRAISVQEAASLLR